MDGTCSASGGFEAQRAQMLAHRLKPGCGPYKGPGPMHSEHSPQLNASSSADTGGAVISFADRKRTRRAAADAASHAPAGDLSVRARVAALTDTCWCCRNEARAIVGVLVDPAQTPDGSGFLPLETVDTALMAALDGVALSRRGIGRLRHRDSPGVKGGYIANGCLECDALIGRFHLEDLLTDHRNAGGSDSRLDTGIAVELTLHAAERRSGISALG